MGDVVELRLAGATRPAYLAAPREGAGLGVLVVHTGSGGEGVAGICDRLAGEGFTALAAPVAEEAGGHSTGGDPDAVSGELAAAVDLLVSHAAVRGHGVGVVGLGVGPAHLVALAARRRDVRAIVLFGGASSLPTAPDVWARVDAAVEAHYGDDELDAAGTEALATRVESLGRDLRVFTYPGVATQFLDPSHAAAPDNDAARQAWVRTLEFLRAKLG